MRRPGKPSYMLLRRIARPLLSAAFIAEGIEILQDPQPLADRISPVLDRRAPMAMDYIRRTATKNDYFASADNGAGYCEPGMLQEPRQ